jgi:hypothetical protein
VIESAADVVRESCGHADVQVVKEPVQGVADEAAELLRCGEINLEAAQVVIRAFQ